MITLLKNCSLLNKDYGVETCKNILIDNDRIVGFPDKWDEPVAQIVDVGGKLVIPGFVQTHVHLCQVLFRGLADDLALLDWLKKRIWPLEASHDEESTYLSALLGCMELLASGVTTVCVMDSVRHVDATAQAIYDIGIRAVFGKAMMDYSATPHELGGLPAEFMETTEESLDCSLRLLKGWHGKDNDRMRYAFMPRGILTTSETLLTELKAISKEYNVIVHTHACETIDESRLVEKARGSAEIKYLNRLGLTNERLLLAHCLCVDEEDLQILAEDKVGVATCPIANLKLASGIAPLEMMAQKGIRLSIGSDGAPCNNNLDIFQEMKFASLLQKGTMRDPQLMPAWKIFDIATAGGANVLGWGDDCGRLEIGKKADLAIVDMDKTETAPSSNSISTLVYSANPRMVTDTMVDGKWVYRNSEICRFDEFRVRDRARKCLNKVMERFKSRKSLILFIFIYLMAKEFLK